MTSTGKKVLIIDDEEDVRNLIGLRLQRAGYDTVAAANGLEGMRLFYKDRPDLVILDVAMPEMDGWQVLQRLREVSNVPVLMLTALAQERDKVKGLRGGADDYVTKPFGKEELLARVEAALRRADIQPEQVATNAYRDSEIAIDFPRHEVIVRGRPVDLSPTEFKLLGMLTRNVGQVLSQDQLLDVVWGKEYAESIDVVRLYIGYLRRKIEIDSANPKLIDTVRGFGYRYRSPQES